MKSRRFYLFFLALTLATVATAAESAMNPYTSLVSRNIFGLVPIPTNPPVEAAPVEPPTKITPNGIMNLFGKLQVLFKTPGKAKAGQPAKEESYVMGVGERQDDIEVKKIDEPAGIVTFDNHGVIQELSLVIAQNVSPATSVGPSTPALTPAQGGAPGFGGARFGRAARNRPPGSEAGNPSNPQPPSNPLGAGVNPPVSNEEALSPEAQVIMIEKNRLDTQEQVEQGLLPPLPPTPITPNDATAFGGSSLIAPNAPTPPPK